MRELNFRLLLILGGSSLAGEGGIPSVAVECADIGKNTGGEGGLLGHD